MLVPHHPRVRNPQLAAALARRGKTGRSLAAEIGIHENTLSSILNCRSVPTKQTATRIAKALRSTPRALGLIDGRTVR